MTHFDPVKGQVTVVRRIQIGMFWPIRVDHTNCLQVAIKTHSIYILQRQKDKGR